MRELHGYHLQQVSDNLKHWSFNMRSLALGLLVCCLCLLIAIATCNHCLLTPGAMHAQYVFKDDIMLKASCGVSTLTVSSVFNLRSYLHYRLDAGWPLTLVQYNMYGTLDTLRPDGDLRMVASDAVYSKNIGQVNFGVAIVLLPSKIMYCRVLGLFLLVYGSATVASAVGTARRHRIRRKLSLCLTCGYPVSTAEVCSECGTLISNNTG